MKLYMVVIHHKRAVNFIEILKVFDVKYRAEKYMESFNIGRFHCRASIKEQEVVLHEN